MLNIDWKFFATIVATLAGVVVPIVIWQVDLSSKSITFEVISITNLEPSTPQHVPGLALALDGAQVFKPVLSVLQIRNTGSRPVLASEFESPFEIVVSSPVKLLRVEVSSVEPIDLKPSISVSDSKILIQPLLLNPKDSVRLNVLTSEAYPIFSIRSRIAGVPNVITSIATESNSNTRVWKNQFISVLLLSVYVTQMMQILEAYNRRSVVQLWTILTAVTSLFGGVALLDSMNELNDVAALLRTGVFAITLGLMFVFIRSRFQNDESL